MSRGRAALLLLAVGLLGAYVSLRLQVGTDITHFMPDRHASRLGEISTRLADSPFSRTMLLSVEGETPEASVAVARHLSAQLAGHPELEWLRGGVDEGQLRELYALYFPRRHALLSDEPERELPDWLSEAALRARARELKARLASPGAVLVEQLATTDPIGAFERVLGRFQAGEWRVESRGGQFVAEGGRYAILLLGLRGSAFHSGPQKRLLADIEVAFARATRELGLAAQLESSGVNRFAVAIEERMRGDIALIAALSGLGVAALFLLLVGSARGFLVVSVPPATGILVATAASLAVFGRIDGLTMAFGASLMGIAIDYSNHVLIHHGLSREGAPARACVRRLRPSLVLGAATTVASLGGMAVTAFPAFREMSFFAGVGVAAALAATLWVVPDLLGLVPRLPKRAPRLAARFADLHAGLLAAPRLLAWLPLALAAVCAPWLGRLEFEDDMSALAVLDPELQAEDNRVRARVGAPDAGNFVVGVAPDERSAVALADAIHAELAPLVERGALTSTRSLHGLVWSEELQLRNLRALRAQPELAARVDAAFAAEGFQPGAFAAFENELAREPELLTLADVRASPLAPLLRPYSFALGDEVAVVTYLDTPRDLDAVRAAVAGRKDVFVLDQRDFVSDVYAGFRATTLRQLAVGALLVLALLAARYRAWRPTLAAFLPSAVVALLVLEGFALAGVRANLMHVMSLVMVMGMGVDYGVFLVDSARRGGEVGATLVSLLMSCLTTAFVFGALAVSSQPALRAIGLTTGAGILLAFALAPLTLAALGLRTREVR